MKLSDWLEQLCWSKVELAKQAGISVQSASRACDGIRLERDTAGKIIHAISKAIGKKLTLDDVEGLNIVGIKRRKKSRKSANVD